MAEKASRIPDMPWICTRNEGHRGLHWACIQVTGKAIRHRYMKWKRETNPAIPLDVVAGL
jgi:hypothetical protein